MSETERPETEPRPEAKGWDKFASVVKAILTGNRREDKNARIMAVLLALVGILGQSLLRADTRTDKVLEAYQKDAVENRKDSKESREIMLRAVIAQERMAQEMERFRIEALEKIPPALPAPRPTVTPLPARRRP